MLQKKKTRSISKFKYLFVLPVVASMLFYVSCKDSSENPEVIETSLKVSDQVQEFPFMVVEEAPVFPGCESATDTRSCFIEKIQIHIRNNFNYPEEAKEEKIEGKVNAIFNIDEKGNISNIKTSGPHEILEKEVELLIKSLPKMQPGRHKGSVVSVPFSVPITFKLD